ncbi:Nucleotide-diphospho-sugar transferase family protein [Rhynchospora pubera]|uniref:Nucleotide-diphospho-sugar transferase family protein n=1 Tax=Rhynchospora pubera TaxID=906938 RepID=A0AAV8G471_9POAL|nr:Nucleotide-diphospho-sugar transferase family protein [Rhynchospora pubera]
MIASFILGVGVTLTLVVLYQAANFDDQKSLEKLSFANVTGGNLSLANGTVNVTHQEPSPFQDLAPLLREVADDDGTIIMTSVNWAWAQQDSLLDLFLQSFRTGENIEHFLKHLLVVAFDGLAFERCKVVHPYCYQLMVDMDFTGQQGFLTKGYIELVWAKVELQRYILEQGYNFLFTDVDIIWFRNPFKHITVYADMTTSSDGYIGDPDDINNSPNTGFFYVKSSNITVQMMRYWHDARKRFPPHHEQAIFINIKQELVNSLGIKLQFVDTKYFGTFGQFSTDLNKICTMHANACVNGLGAKLPDLKGLMEYWKNYTALPIEEKKKGLFTWRKPTNCRL